MSSPRILALGRSEGASFAALEGSAMQTGMRLSHFAGADEAISELDQGPWKTILVDITTAGASRFCQEARARRLLFNVPLIAMTPQPTDLAFSNAFRWGADDLVEAGRADPIVRRLRHLPETAPLLDPERGEAVIADSDRGRCDVLGRVLANAGYTVRYATDLISARYYFERGNVRLFVLNDELGPPAELLKDARRGNSSAHWVVTARQKELSNVRDSLHHFERVAVMSSHGPPENVLFALNFVNPEPGGRRSQARALYGAMALFRPEGEEQDECGYTYSVSANGMYVRTLLPPPDDNLWVELEPPGAARRVRLLGKVVWTRQFGQPGAETAPPGFGVRLYSGLGNELQIWERGFNTLEGSQPDSHAIPEVKVTPQPFRVPLPGTLSGASKPSTSAGRSYARNSAPIISITNSVAPRRAPSTKAEQDSQNGDGTQESSPETRPVPLEQRRAIPSADQRSPSSQAEGSNDRRTGSARSQGNPGPQTEATAGTGAAPTGGLPPKGATPSSVAESSTAPAPPPPPSPETPAPGKHYAPVPAAVVSLKKQGLIDPRVTLDRNTPPATQVGPEDGENTTPPRSGPSGPGGRGTARAPTAGESARTKRRPLMQLGIGAVVGLSIAAAWVLAPRVSAWMSRQSRATAEPSASRAPDTPPRVERAGQGPASVPPSPAQEEAPSAQAEPSRSDTEAVAAAPPRPSAESQSPVPTAPPPPPESSELDADEAWLRVDSGLSAQVFVHGVDVGPTNQWLRSKCGMRFIRLGKRPGEWLSEGAPHQLTCGELTTLSIEP